MRSNSAAGGASSLLMASCQVTACTIFKKNPVTHFPPRSNNIPSFFVLPPLREKNVQYRGKREKSCYHVTSTDFPLLDHVTAFFQTPPISCYLKPSVIQYIEVQRHCITGGG
jgi:hypothetical protein